MKSTKTKDFSFVLTGRVISAGFQALFYFLFASLLEPELYGNLSYLIAIAGVVSTLSIFGLNHTVVIFHSKKQSNIANQINVLAVTFTSIASVILLLVDFQAALLCLASSFFMMNIFNQIGLKKYKKYMFLNIAKGIAVLFLPLIFYYYFDFLGIIIGMILAYFITSFNFFRFLNLNVTSYKIISTKFDTIVNNFGVHLSMDFIRYIDKLLVGIFLGFTSLGIYNLNIQILLAFEMLPISLHSFLLSEESSKNKSTRINIIAILSSVLIAILVIILSPIFFQELLPKYVEGVPSLQLLIISIVPLTISAILSAKLQAKNSKIIGLTAIVRIGTLSILIFILGSIYGLIGLSFAVLISTIFYTSSLFLIYQKEKNSKFGDNLTN
jgi:O-antigen/teichoic acid export membrane protein